MHIGLPNLGFSIVQKFLINYYYAKKNDRTKRNLSVVARDRGLRASISVDEELPRLVLDKMPRHQA